MVSMSVDVHERKEYLSYFSFCLCLIIVLQLLGVELHRDARSPPRDPWVPWVTPRDAMGPHPEIPWVYSATLKGSQGGTGVPGGPSDHHTPQGSLGCMLWLARIARKIRALACRPCARLAKEGTCSRSEPSRDS